MKIVRQYQKLKRVYLKVAVAACLFIIFVIPFASRFNFTDDVAAEEAAAGVTCFSVVLNGERIGVVENAEEAKAALLSVRARLNEEYGVTVYADTDLQLYADTNYSGRFTSREDLENSMYNSVLSCAYIPNDTAYTVRIDDFMVTVRTEADVIALLEAAKNRVVGTEGFQVELVDAMAGGYSQRTVNVTTADIAMNEAARVLATIDGTDTVQVTEDTVFEDGILYVGFAEDIEIIETRGKDTDVVSVQEALDMITKEKAEKETYEVVSGDCLSRIAEKTNVSLDELYELNEGLTADTILYEGDLLTITVPKPEISVIVKEEVTYEEEYQADIVYVDNNNMYQGQQNVISYGTPGYRQVIAVVSYNNGKEYEREYLSQTIITEAVPTVIERGTLIPPTFINPVNYTTITSYWGPRVHPTSGTSDFHTGVDMYVPTGTAVKASCGGTVTFAGWKGGTNGGYGYCVDISHGNGLVTRYGHLSSIEVTVGQTVVQGERIALSGATGNVTGPHLHFEVLLYGNSKNPFDYLNK